MTSTSDHGSLGPSRRSRLLTVLGPPSDLDANKTSSSSRVSISETTPTTTITKMANHVPGRPGHGDNKALKGSTKHPQPRRSRIPSQSDGEAPLALSTDRRIWTRHMKEDAGRGLRYTFAHCMREKLTDCTVPLNFKRNTKSTLFPLCRKPTTTKPQPPAWPAGTEQRAPIEEPRPNHIENLRKTKNGSRT